MARKSKAEKLIDNEVTRCYGLHGSGVQIDMLDIGKIYEAGHAAAYVEVEGVKVYSQTSIEEAVKAAITILRKN